MNKMGLQAVYSKPNTSLKHPDHKIYPYLLRGLDVTFPNHVWNADITNIRTAVGFLYLTAVIGLV